ncbi:adenylate/guanylate cyclase domain-containing protein [Dyadobacter sp. OTU695]|uniref:adenylate/guanylate cyclase domain-containing protein n=1 Tax=Dyadobacter sp. OTU695 TaxID=3043860 RepID=UPI00313B150F
MDYFLERKFLRNTSLGRIMAIKAIVCLVLMICCFLLLQYVFLDLIFAGQLTQTRALVITSYNWEYLFLLVLAYTFFMTLVVNFIGEVDKKFGPGVLLPLLLGKYRRPKEEERIFMFMDLKSSTSIAEKLGHIMYSSFISDCFMDINHALFPCNAEVYQYVGDEIVVSWPAVEGLRDFSSTRFFFTCEKYIQHRAQYYLSNYGIVPVFKAGMHIGTVTAVEIGEIKRDIAYHGDTLNTAARIQGLCNEYGKRLLVSGYFFDRSGIEGHFPTREIATILLKGKSVPVRILSVETTERYAIES